MSKAVTLIQVDIETCSLVYGTAPCTASIPTTGENKCFNSRKTCQDIDNISTQLTTLTFSKPSDTHDFDTLPLIESVSFNPASVSLGQDLGQRATLSVSMKDGKHSDVGEGFDPYHADRSYNPWDQGTFFGKFRARQPFLRGKNIRLLRGFQGDAIADMEAWNFVIESFDGPNPKGRFTLIAKDILKLADGDRSQAPNLSGGFLSADISFSATSFTANPSGIGDTDYPSSGLIAVGGKEIMSFTRSGDVFTVVRAQQETEAIAHDGDSRVQLCLQYTADSPADIIRDLLVTYSGVDSSYINLSEWSTEVDSFLGTVYSTIVSEPTSIKKLVSEIVEQAAISLFWEPLEQKIKLKVLRQITTDADTFNYDNLLVGTLSSKEQPDKRISQVWTYFARVNPLSQLDQPQSYKSTIVTIDSDAEIEYDTSVIKKIFSRWIPLGGRSIASRLNDIQVARFRDAPRKFNFQLFHDASVLLGEGYQLGAYQLQNELGEEVTAPIQVTRLSKNESVYAIEAEEVLFQDLEPLDPNDHTIIFDSSTNDVNLKDVHDSLFPTETSDTVISVYVESGVIIGASATSGPAMDVGAGWDAGAEINIYIRGRIQGAGGRGGNSGGTGQAGGDALHVDRAVTLDFESGDGEIWSGGGGGGGATAGQGSKAGGGGGQGQAGGNGGSNAPGSNTSSTASGAGTSEASGAGGFVQAGGFSARGGAGGAAGASGSTGNGGSGGGSAAGGGAAGNAIDGVSNVTFVNDGSKDIRGSQVN